MEQKRITAVLRTDVLDEVETQLHRLGVRGITVSRVEGYGEHAKVWRSEVVTKHVQIEIFIDEDRVQEIVETILHIARVEADGDGIVAVLPVDALYRVRNR